MVYVWIYGGTFGRSQSFRGASRNFTKVCQRDFKSWQLVLVLDPLNENPKVSFSIRDFPIIYFIYSLCLQQRTARAIGSSLDVCISNCQVSLMCVSISMLHSHGKLSRQLSMLFCTFCVRPAGCRDNVERLPALCASQAGRLIHNVPSCCCLKGLDKDFFFWWGVWGSQQVQSQTRVLIQISHLI